MNTSSTHRHARSGPIALLCAFFAAAALLSMPSTARAAGLPVATSSAATNVTSTTATINGTFGSNGATTVAFFDLGLTASYGQRFQITELNAGVISIGFAVGLTSLQPGLTPQTILIRR